MCWGGVQAAIGWYEIYTRKYNFISENNADFFAKVEGRRIPIAMLGNPNDFALFMFITALFALALCYIQRFKRIRILLIIFIINALILIYKSESRAVLLGVVIALFTVFWGSSEPLIKLFLVVGIVMLFIFNVNTLVNMVKEELVGMSSVIIRINLIKNGIHFLIDTYGFGIGNGQVEYWMKNYYIYNAGNVLNMHNWWAEILTAYGVGIFLLFVIFYIKLIYDFDYQYKVLKKGSEGKFYLVLTGTLCGYFLASITCSSNFSNEFTWYFLAIMISVQGNLFKNKEVMGGINEEKS